jgi:hypothetical protein
VASSGNQDVTGHAIGSMRGRETVMMKKSGRV